MMNRYLAPSALEAQQLLAMTIHDLRTPVTAIKGFGQLVLRRRDLSPDARDHLQTMVAEANRLAGYLDDLALLTRIEEGESLASPVELPLEMLVEQSLARAQSGPIHVGQLSPALTAQYDPELTRRAMQHLIRVAFKHAAADEPVQLTTGHASGRPVLAVATDRAAGVSWEGMDSDGSAANGAPPNEATDGHDVATRGLGLYLASRLVEAQGGQLWIETPLDGGACFVIVFPEHPTTPAGLASTTLTNGGEQRWS